MNVNKQFLKECALYIRGEVSEIKIRGNSRIISLFANTLSESRRLYLALQSGKLNKALPLLESKRAASRVLREKTGYVWPL